MSYSKPPQDPRRIERLHPRDVEPPMALIPLWQESRPRRRAVPVTIVGKRYEESQGELEESGVTVHTPSQICLCSEVGLVSV